jgi:hypothetical protein
VAAVLLEKRGVRLKDTLVDDTVVASRQRVPLVEGEVVLGVVEE